jgi:hypothetical protein
MGDAVIGNWQEGQRSDPKEGGKDFISMNREGIKRGFIDSKVTQQRHSNYPLSARTTK